MLLADVALPIPLPHPLTYEVPAALDTAIVPGARVLVPLARRRMVGVVVERREGEPPKGIKPVESRVDDELPCLPEELLTFLKELALYYLAPPGEVMRLALPPIEKKTQKIL